MEVKFRIGEKFEGTHGGQHTDPHESTYPEGQCPPRGSLLTIFILGAIHASIESGLKSEYLKLVVKKKVSLSFHPVSTIDQAQQLHAMSEQRHQAEVAKIGGRSFLIVCQIGMKA